MHRLPHLLDHLQERLDQPRRHGVRLVQQRRDQAGIGYPKEWENQEKWKGGWVRAADVFDPPRIGGKFRVLANIFPNPTCPRSTTTNRSTSTTSTAYRAQGRAPAGGAPASLVSGQRMEKIEWGPNWEEILGTGFAKRRKGQELRPGQADICGEYENTFMMYLPRLCEKPEPGVRGVLPERGDLQARGGRHRPDRPGQVPRLADVHLRLPDKKIYFNWKSVKSEKCIFCYPRIEAGQPTVCSETCVRRILPRRAALRRRPYHGVGQLRRTSAAVRKQLEIFLDPFDPAVIAQAQGWGGRQRHRGGRSRRKYKLAMDWLALPLHPEYRTLPMVWYVPPLSPIQNAAAEGTSAATGRSRTSVVAHPVRSTWPAAHRRRHRAGTAGAQAPAGDARLQARRAASEGRQDLEVLAKVRLSVEQVEEDVPLPPSPTTRIAS